VRRRRTISKCIITSPLLHSLYYTHFTTLTLQLETQSAEKALNLEMHNYCALVIMIISSSRSRSW
jgi:hypothetical protein